MLLPSAPRTEPTSTMATAGAPWRAIQEWMGHADYRTTSIYADYAPDSSRGALDAAGSHPSLVQRKVLQSNDFPDLPAAKERLLAFGRRYE
jgi:hypothetical protein